MPLIQANGLRHYYRLDGADDKPVLVLSHSLGCDHSQWDAQTAALAPHFRILSYDTRGHGATEAPAGDYKIETLAQDVLALTNALQLEQFAFCGLSLGGMIGQWIAAHAPDKVTHLVLANTSPRFPDPSIMEARRKLVLEQGMAAIEAAVLSRFFLPSRVAANPIEVANERRVLRATDPEGYAGCCAAIRDMNQVASLCQIKAPTLIVCGDHDVSTPFNNHGEVLAQHIPHAQVVHLPTAHLSNLEQPRSFNAALLNFLTTPNKDGLAKRRAILGDAHVDRAIANTTPFTKDFQQLITDYAWGTIWQRPGLDDRTRRLLVLTATAALGRWEEFRLHLRTGLAHELEPCDLEEVLMQLAIYAGVPAANHGFHIASEELTKPQ